MEAAAGLVVTGPWGVQACGGEGGREREGGVAGLGWDGWWSRADGRKP